MDGETARANTRNTSVLEMTGYRTSHRRVAADDSDVSSCGRRREAPYVSERSKGRVPDDARRASDRSRGSCLRDFRCEDYACVANGTRNRHDRVRTPDGVNASCFQAHPRIVVGMRQVRHMPGADVEMPSRARQRLCDPIEVGGEHRRALVAVSEQRGLGVPGQRREVEVVALGIVQLVEVGRCVPDERLAQELFGAARGRTWWLRDRVEMCTRPGYSTSLPTIETSRMSTASSGIGGISSRTSRSGA